MNSKLLLSFLLLLFSNCQAQVSDYSYLSIQDPQSWDLYNGYISSFQAEITPDNDRARVDMTFVIHVDSISAQHKTPTL